jgi:pyruvate ferredoxin oxidoreductase alpha subunit
MKKLLEGSQAVAEAIRLCKPGVVAAYPITPQTHIAQEIAQLVADGELKAELVTVESEHSAASCVLGAVATGVRAFTASASQGILLMTEVLFNMAGMRLPAVITCVNRAVSAPLNIWNDQQDSISVRDSGVIQLYVETNQEVLDTHVQAYKIAEHKDVLLPVMVCMDGYYLSHTFEPVEMLDEAKVREFLPDYEPLYRLNPEEPLTFGAFADPSTYMETRYLLHKASTNALHVINDVAAEFKDTFGRYSGGTIDSYRLEDAEFVYVTMGSLVETLRFVVDEMRNEGHKVGLLKVRAYRPFPALEIRNVLKDVQNVAVLEKNVSIGSGGALCKELRDALYGLTRPYVSGFIVGLGGKEITMESLKGIFHKVIQEPVELSFLDLDKELIGEA